MPLLAALLATLLGGLAGYNINTDPATCDAAELTFRADYADGRALLGTETDPGGGGYAYVYGSQQAGPQTLSIYVIAGAEDHMSSLKMTPIGICTNGAGQEFRHFLVTELPPRIQQHAPRMPDL